MVVVMGTTLVTIVWDLNYAVVIFTVFYQAMRLLPDEYSVDIPDFGVDEAAVENSKNGTGSKGASVDESVEVSALQPKRTSLTSVYGEIELVESSTALRIANPLSFVIAAVVNGLSSTGVLSRGTGVGDVSDNNPTLITPASFAFSIWGVIYTLLAAFCLWSAAGELPLPSWCGGKVRAPFISFSHTMLCHYLASLTFGSLVQASGGRFLSRDGTLLSRRIGWLFVASNVCNSLWLLIFVWDTPATAWISTVLILGLEGCLIAIHVRAGLWNTPRDSIFIFLIVDVGFSIYLGWVTVASIVNVSVALVTSGVNPMETEFWTAEGWACFMLSAAAVLALTMLATRHDLGYPLVLVWALSAIVANNSNPDVEVRSEQVQAVGISLAGTVFTMTVFMAGKWAFVRRQAGLHTIPPLLFVSQASDEPVREKRPSINSIVIDPAPVVATTGSE